MNCRYLFVLTGLIFTFFAFACGNGQLQQNQSGTSPANSNQTNNSRSPQMPSEPPAITSKVNPERLINIIKELQMKYVGESWGTEAGQCFTDVALNKFMSEKKTAEIVEHLQKDKDFIAVVNAIKDLKTEERSVLLDKGLKTYKQSWRELRLDPQTASADKLREGQTDAGQKAEKLIAQTVVDLVKASL